MTRRPHGRYHDATVTAAAITTLGAVWFAFHLTATPQEPPADTNSLAAAPAREAAQTPSRTQVRVPVPVPLHVVPEPSPAPTPGVRVGKPNPGAGLIPPLRCIRSQESGGGVPGAFDYRAFNGVEHYGAFQLSATYSPTWARRYGYPQWADVTADRWPRRVQNTVASRLFRDWPNAWTTYKWCT